MISAAKDFPGKKLLYSFFERMSSPKIIFKQPQEPPIRFPAHFLQFPRIVGGGVGLFFRRSDDWVDLRGKATKQFGYFRDYFLLYSQVITEDSYKTQPTKMVQIAFAGKDHISYLRKFGKSSTQVRAGWDGIWDSSQEGIA